jgi:aspartate aminotransferase
MTEAEPLEELRREAASLTTEIVRLIGRRNSVAGRIGALKSNLSLPVDDEKVEDSLVRQVLDECDRSGVSRAAGLKVLSVLLSESKRVQGAVQPPAESPMSSFARAIQLQRQGRRSIIRLDVGEPDFAPPRSVLEACARALFSFKTHYTLTRGIPELISELRLYLSRKHGYDASEEELMVTPGGRFAVYSAIASIVKEGESAIVVEPSWPAYRQSLQHVGARAVVIHTALEDSWEFPIEKLKESIKPNTRAIILSYPNNPTGKIITQSSFREIVGVANDAGLTVISDEIYNDYAYRPCPTVLESGAEKFVLTASFSKTWAMTGFRIGYAVSSRELISRMLALSSLMVTSVPEFIQYGAIEALRAEAEVERNSRTMKERIDAACAELDRLDSLLSYYRPDGAMYVFPQFSRSDMDSQRFSEELLERGVSVTPGTAFGNYTKSFRISLCQPAELLQKGIREIGRALS